VIEADFWRRLGIAATADARAIRSAYAARLKALNVDAERDAFALLRTARNQALAWAATAPDEPEAPAEMPEPRSTPEAGGRLDDLRTPIISAAGDIRTLAPEMPEDFAGSVTAPHFRAPTTAEAAIMVLPGLTVPLVHPLPPAEGRIDVGGSPPQDDQALYALLLTPEDEVSDEPLGEDEIAQARVHIDALAAQAKAGTIDFDAQVQAWLSGILAQSWPRSEPLLEQAAACFGWEAQRGKIDVPPAIACINTRIAAARFIAAVQKPGHRLHNAWRQLTRPTRDGQTRAIWWQPTKITELLNTVRRHYPELESHFGAGRVALWDRRQKVRSAFPWRLGIFGVIVLQIVLAVGRYANEHSEVIQPPSMVVDGRSTPVTRNPNSGPGALTEREADVASAIHANLGADITPNQLHNKAPLVAMLYRSNWGVALDQGKSLDDYIARMGHIIRDRYALLARQTGSDVLIALQRFRLAEARALQAHNPGSCAQMMRKGVLADPDLLPAAVADGERKAITRLILAIPDNPATPSRGAETFSIPGPIVGRMIATSGLSTDQVETAFRGEGDDRAICRATIALLQAVLDSDAPTRADLLPKI
jgi:hypothetical protein